MVFPAQDIARTQTLKQIYLRCTQNHNGHLREAEQMCEGKWWVAEEFEHNVLSI